MVLAYVAMAAGKLPLGNSRHSVYLFPFLFGLVTSPVSDMLRGSHGTLSRLGRLVVGAGATAYVAACVLDYAKEVEFVPYASGRVRELLTHYRQDDVDRAFEILRQRAKPEDVVMVTVQGAYALRVHFGLSPVLDPTPAQQDARDVRLAMPLPGPLRHTAANVHFYQSAQGGFMFTPESLARGVREVRKYFGLEEPPRVWAIRTGWEQPLAPQFQQQHPGVPVDLEVHRETHGILFAIAGPSLAKIDVK